LTPAKVGEILNWYKKAYYPGIVIAMIAIHPRRALGAFIRAHRERLPPPAAFSGRRRTPGLRREELAEALRLASAERAYLFTLAGKRDPSEPAPSSHDLPPKVLGLPERITIPAYLLDGTWTARSWNSLAATLFSGWLDADHDRNLMRFIFLSPQAPRLIADWDDRARRVAAEFRADFSCRLHDPAMLALVDGLIGHSPIFQRLWREQAVLGREGGERRFNNPPRRFHQSTLIVSANPDMRLVCLTPL